MRAWLASLQDLAHGLALALEPLEEDLDVPAHAEMDDAQVQVGFGLLRAADLDPRGDAECLRRLDHDCHDGVVKRLDESRRTHIDDVADVAPHPDAMDAAVPRRLGPNGSHALGDVLRSARIG